MRTAKTHGLFNVSIAKSGREMSNASEGRRYGYNVRAIYHVGDVVTKDGQFCHGGLESILQLGLVVYINIDGVRSEYA